MFHGDTGERTKVRSSRNSVPTMWSQPCGTPGAWRQLRNTYVLRAQSSIAMSCGLLLSGERISGPRRAITQVQK
jgi:hypothetical protein